MGTLTCEVKLDLMRPVSPSRNVQMVELSARPQKLIERSPRLRRSIPHTDRVYERPNPLGFDPS